MSAGIGRRGSSGSELQFNTIMAFTHIDTIEIDSLPGISGSMTITVELPKKNGGLVRKVAQPEAPEDGEKV